MSGWKINLPRHRDRLGLGLKSLELDAVVGLAELAALEFAKEIEMPPGSAEFAVGDRLQADRFLPADNGLYLAVFDLSQAGIAELLRGVSGACVFEGGRSKKASDHVGPKRRLCTLHTESRT